MDKHLTPPRLPPLPSCMAKFHNNVCMLFFPSLPWTFRNRRASVSSKGRFGFPHPSPFPTSPFTISEPQNPNVVVQERRATGFKTPELWKGSSGPSRTYYYGKQTDKQTGERRILLSRYGREKKSRPSGPFPLSSSQPFFLESW